MSSSKSSSTSQTGPEDDAGLAPPGDAAPPPLRLHVVEAGEAGTRLDRLLSGLPGVSSRQAAQRLIAEGHVRLNAQPAEADRAVRTGDRLQYDLPPARPSALQPQAAPPGQLEILYEDAWLVVINKPAGLSMHPGPGHAQGTLVHYLLAHCPDLSGIGGELRPGIVHRLDKDTSGVLVVAKNDAAHLGLAAQFKARTIQRLYYALVLGDLPGPSGSIDLPIGRHPVQRMRRAVVAGGRRAVTHWWVERRLPPFSLLRLKLETGRTHQIRVHLAHQGWPVVGDPLYGRKARLPALPEPARSRLLAFRRQALHAAELGFVHPATQQPLHFVTPLPRDFQELLQALARRQSD